MQGNRQMHSLPRLGFLKKMNITLVFYRSPLKYSLSSYQFSNESVDLNLKPSYSENLLPLYLLDSRLFPLLIHSVLDFKINRPKHLKDQSWYFSRLLKSVLWLCHGSHSNRRRSSHSSQKPRGTSCITDPGQLGEVQI